MRLVPIIMLLVPFCSVQTLAQQMPYLNHQLVSDAMANPQNAYHHLLSKVAPLVLRRMYGGGSATIVAKSKDGQGLVLTALHIETSKFPQEADSVGLKDSGDWAFELQPIRRNDKYPVESVIDNSLDAQHVIPVLSGFTLYSPKANMPYQQVNANLRPERDFALIALPQVGAWYWSNDPSTGFPNQLAGKYAPQALISISAVPLGIAEPTAGSEAVLIGFPASKSADPRTQNVLNIRNGQSFSTGRVLGDSEAEELLQNIEGAEKSLPYNRAAEFVVAGNASIGFSGGGAFDLNGKYLGILVRAGKSRNGRDYVRVVRATYVLPESLRKIRSLKESAVREQTLGLFPNDLVQRNKINSCEAVLR